MKKEEIPQDESALKNFTKEVTYAQDEKGQYGKNLSTGWEVKASALDHAWEHIHETVQNAYKAVQSGEKSPIFYWMEKHLMDFPTLSGYTGFWIFTIKRHLQPNVFKKLSEKKLSKYAEAFSISLEELKNPKP